MYSNQTFQSGATNQSTGMTPSTNQYYQNQANQSFAHVPQQSHAQTINQPFLPSFQQHTLPAYPTSTMAVTSHFSPLHQSSSFPTQAAFHPTQATTQPQYFTQQPVFTAPNMPYHTANYHGNVLGHDRYLNQDAIIPSQRQFGIGQGMVGQGTFGQGTFGQNLIGQSTLGQSGYVQQTPFPYGH